jgi:serine/threonine-protein kinase
MGTVFRAVEQQTGRLVAIKMPRSGPPDREAGARLRLETEVMAGLNHPNLVPLLAAFEADGVQLLVMPYVEGESLAQRLRREQRLSPPDAVRVVQQIAQALAACHERGVVHRDIKPSNIYLDSLSGCALLMDFGLARPNETAHAVAESETGRVVGTPTYMSPEQVTNPTHVDSRGDVYSLGVVLYELLTGQPPFRAVMPLLLWQVLHEEPVAARRVNADVPPELEAITRKCLAKEPSRRYQTVEDLDRELGCWLRKGAGPQEARAPRSAWAKFLAGLRGWLGRWWRKRKGRTRSPGCAGMDGQERQAGPPPTRGRRGRSVQGGR